MSGRRLLTGRLSVVYLYVADLDRSLEFYRDLLGLPLEADADDPYWVEATLSGGTRFALHAAGASIMPQVPGTMRVNFEVDDIDAAAERLAAAGVRIGQIEREPWGQMVEVFDPDGYAIELFRPPGS